MSRQERAEFRAEHLFDQVDNEVQLNYRTPNNPKNMLESSLQNCKSFTQLSAIFLSTVSLLIVGQPEQAQASTSTNILNHVLSESPHNILNWENSFVSKSNFFALKKNPLAFLKINQNIDKNIASTLPTVEINQPVNTERAGLLEKSLSHQNLVLEKQPNWISSTGESTDHKGKEYIFQIPPLNKETTQKNQYIEPNSKISGVNNTIKKIHTVKRGDTLNKIATHYGIPRQQLIKQNNIQNPNQIFVSQQIKIPHSKTTAKVEANKQSNSWGLANTSTRIVAQNRYRTDNSPRRNFTPQLSGLDNSPIENNKETIKSPLGINITLGAIINPELPPLSSPEQYLPTSPSPAKFNGYVWPARGTLTSGYGWRWGRPHKGIDIAAPIGTPIVAAASGEVISAGWNSGGYGNLVKVKHPNGSVTMYAHNHRIMVRRGQKVRQGQQIAKMGSTGRSTGSHLHFEIRSNGQTAVNPMAFLPKK